MKLGMCSCWGYSVPDRLLLSDRTNFRQQGQLVRGPFRCALATLLALTMSLPSANTRGDESFAVSASTELLQSGLADHSYDQFLHTLFNSLLTRVGDHTPIRVNEIARANHINVYIINLANYDQNLRKKLRPSLIRILDRLKNNALSYPPNFMIFDQDYVASITENAFFDQLHLRLALDAGKHRQVELGASDVDPDILATYGFLDDILRFRELRQYRYPGGDEELRKTGARIAYNVMREQVIVPYMDFAFSPIFFHEQGHLVTLSEGGFFEFLDELAASFANRRVASAEAIADKFAVAQLSKAIGQAAKDTRIEEVSAVVSTLKLLRDQVLIDAFSGFRGLEPENFLYYLVHKDCRAEEFKETKALEFFDPRKIHAVYRTFFPLLLPQEFAAIRRGLLMNARFGTHQNHAIRVDQFLAIVSEGFGWDMNNLNVASKLLEASVEGSPFSDLAPEVPINGMKLSYDELFDGLQGLNVGQPINCPDRTCSVAKFADGTPGFINLLVERTSVWCASSCRFLAQGVPGGSMMWIQSMLEIFLYSCRLLKMRYEVTR